MLIQIVRRIGKCRKNDHLFVARIDWLFHLITQHGQQSLQLAIVFRSDVRNHKCQQLQNFLIPDQSTAPRFIIHVRQGNLDLSAKAEQIIILILTIKLFQIREISQCNIRSGALIVFFDGLDGALNLLLNTLQRESKGIDGAFHTLHQIDGHKAADSLLTSNLSQACIITKEFRVLFHFTGKDVVRRCVNGQCQQH